MNILLTGSGGFIGRNIKETLGNLYTLYCPRSHELNLLNAHDVSAYMSTNKVDLVIHSASAGVRITPNASTQIAEVNLQMFNNLTHSLQGRKLINLGSGAEYDKERNLHEVKESEFGRFVPKSPYGYSKYTIAKTIEGMNHALNLRIFGVYGYYEDPSRFTTYAITQNMNKQSIVINQNVVFDFIFVSDLVKIIEHYINHETQSKSINVCPTRSISLINLSKIINKVGNFESEIITKQEGLNFEYTGSNHLLLKEMPHLTFTSYEDGIGLFYNHLKRIRNL